MSSRAPGSDSRGSRSTATPCGSTIRTSTSTTTCGTRPCRVGHARAAQEALGADHGPAPRPQAAALGDLGGRGSRRRRGLRAHHQDPPLHDRRRLGRRPLPHPALALARDPRAARAAGLRSAAAAEPLRSLARRGGPPRVAALPRRPGLPQLRGGGRGREGRAPGAGARHHRDARRGHDGRRVARSTARSAPTAPSTGWRCRSTSSRRFARPGAAPSTTWCSPSSPGPCASTCGCAASTPRASSSGSRRRCRCARKRSAASSATACRRGSCGSRSARTSRESSSRPSTRRRSG